MDINTIFLLLVCSAVILTISIFTLTNVIKTVLDSDMYREKLDELKKKEKKAKEAGSGKGKKIILPVVLFIMGTSVGHAAESVVQSDSMVITNDHFWAILMANLLLLLVFFYYLSMLERLMKFCRGKEYEKERKKNKVTITQVLTDTVPIEDEASILMDHEYDGIRELDNNLPPWWKWGFYASIVFAIIYLSHYHIFRTGDLQIDVYQKEMAQAELDLKKYLEEQAMNVDENTVIILTDPGELTNGKSLFKQYCISCHGELGEGGIGPNLTDNYWIHGGRINDVFSTIKYGAQNGMKSWKDEFNPIQMQEVASFVKSIGGTNPPNGLDPEGEIFIEEDLLIESDEAVSPEVTLPPLNDTVILQDTVTKVL